MAFSKTIDGKIPMLPPFKRKEQGQYWKIFGTFTNTAGSTGGVIVTGYDKVKSASFSNGTTANGIRVQLNTASDGEITITNTADDDGTWEALVYNR